MIYVSDRVSISVDFEIDETIVPNAETIEQIKTEIASRLKITAAEITSVESKNGKLF